METLFTTSYATTFTLTRLIEKKLQSASFDLVLDIEIDAENEATLQVKNLDKLRTWIETILNNCVAFNVHTAINTDFLAEIDNHIMFCPDEPHDYLLLLLITSKLNAIGNGVILVRSASLNSDTSQGFGYTLLGESNDILISAEDWMGPVRFYDKPWWNRSDGSMIDVAVGENENPDMKPDILISLDNSPIQVLTNRVESDDSKSAEIIKVNFKPNTDSND